MTMPRPPAAVRGTLVEHVAVESVTFDLGSSPPANTFRLFTSLKGPATTSNTSSGIIFGLVFEVTEINCSLVGYSWWCAGAGQVLDAPNFAVFQLITFDTGTLLPAGTITGSSLTAGTWNDTFLPASLPLDVGNQYQAQVGVPNSFSSTTNFWGAGDIAYDGLTNGPLTAFSSNGGSNPSGPDKVQNSFATGTTDPTSGVCQTGNDDLNIWLDVIVSTG